MASDGRITVAGASLTHGAQSQMVVLRYHAGGAFDSRLSGDGILQFSYGRYIDRANAVTVDASGRIAVAGTIGGDKANYDAIVRLTALGHLDHSFAQGGWWSDGARGELLKIDWADGGKYRVSGNTLPKPETIEGNVSARGHGSLAMPQENYLSEDDLLSAGQTTADAVETPDGKLIVLVSQANGFALTRLNNDGSIDRAFGTDGWSDGYAALISYEGEGRGGGLALQLLPDNSILAIGSLKHDNDTDGGLVLAKYLPDGHFDPSFADHGIEEIDGTYDDTYALQLGLEPDDQILASTGGGGGSSVIYQFDRDGSIDPLGNYAVELGKQRPNYYEDSNPTFWIADNGDITIGGFLSSSFEHYSIRIHADGSPVTSFGTNGLRFQPRNARGDEIDPLGEMMPDGTYLFVAQTKSGLDLVRHDANGNLDASFGANGHAILNGANLGGLFSPLLEDDGKILVMGFASSDAARTNIQLFVARFSADGQVDASFGPSGLLSFPVASGIAILHATQVDSQLHVLLGKTVYAQAHTQTYQLVQFPL